MNDVPAVLANLKGVAACRELVALQWKEIHCRRLLLREKEIVQEAVVELANRMDQLEHKLDLVLESLDASQNS